MTRYEIQTLTGVVSSAAVFVFSSLFNRREGAFKERVEALEVDLKTPARAPEGARIDLRGLAAIRVTGRLTALLGGLLLFLVIPTIGNDGWPLNLIAGILCLAIAAGIAVLTSKYEIEANKETQ
jgi:pilus assembly protein TadC